MYGAYHWPGHNLCSTHCPLLSVTCPSGQKQPSAHPSWHIVGAVMLSHVAGHNEPHCWYTIPVGHSETKMDKNYDNNNSVPAQVPSGIVQ